MKKTIIYPLIILVLATVVFSIVPDDDTDGIPNTEDRCADSEGFVGTYGCSCSQKACSDDEWCCKADEICIEHDFQARCVGDDDGDDIYDLFDKCSRTPIGELVDTHGCGCSQKTCNDFNLCTDDSCGGENIECIFTNNDENECGENKHCQNGVCVWNEEERNSEISYWDYDSEKHEVRIFYDHSGHTIEVFFEEPFQEDVVILDSTSDVLSYNLNEDKTMLTLVVEGDPKVRGITTIKTMQKPESINIDKVEIFELKESPSPRNHIWLYLIAIMIMLVILLVVVLSMRRHEEELVSSIKKEEIKIEKEVDLEAVLQLKMYITTNLRRGYTEKQIRDELLRDGWKKHMVDFAFNSLRRRQ